MSDGLVSAILGGGVNSVRCGVAVPSVAVPWRSIQYVRVSVFPVHRKVFHGPQLLAGDTSAFITVSIKSQAARMMMMPMNVLVNIL
jgi:hypothetical protein